MSIIFAKPRFHYNSYTDFWSLVDLSEFETCWIDEIDLKSSNTYVVTLVDPKRDKWCLSWWQRIHKTARLILWDLERPKPRGGIKAHKAFLNRLNFDEVWHSDPQLAKDLGTRFVVLGSDERLRKVPRWTKPYNFALMAHLNDRRKEIVSRINEIAPRVAPNCYGIERQMILGAARFGLNIHQDDDLYYEPLRFALFAAYELPVISEAIYDPFPVHNVLLTWNNYGKLADKCKFYSERYVEDEKWIKAHGLALKRKLCFDYRFRSMVEYAARN